MIEPKCTTNNNNLNTQFYRQEFIKDLKVVIKKFNPKSFESIYRKFLYLFSLFQQFH